LDHVSRRCLLVVIVVLVFFFFRKSFSDECVDGLIRNGTLDQSNVGSSGGDDAYYHIIIIIDSE
jgi:hypothetical protein